MKDILTHMTAHTADSAPFKPIKLDWNAEFAEVSNSNGKIVIKHIAGTVPGEELQITIEEQDLGGGKKSFYSQSPYKGSVSNPQAKGKSLFVKVDKTSIADETLDLGDPKQRVTAETFYFCYRAEAATWTKEDLDRILRASLGVLRDTTGASTCSQFIKGAIRPKDL